MLNILLFSMPGGSELIIIGVIILLIFGGKKIPELMKGLGQGISEFKKNSKGDTHKEVEIQKKD